MDDNFKYFIAGYIAGEGCFYANENRSWYEFTITCHVRDMSILEEIRNILGGSVKVFPSRKNVARFQIGGIYHAKEVIIPFMDKYLIGTYKLDQYLAWREKIMSHQVKRKRKSNNNPM